MGLGRYSKYVSFVFAYLGRCIVDAAAVQLCFARPGRPPHNPCAFDPDRILTLEGDFGAGDTDCPVKRVTFVMFPGTVMRRPGASANEIT